MSRKINALNYYVAFIFFGVKTADAPSPQNYDALYLLKRYTEFKQAAFTNGAVVLFQ